MHDRTHFSYTAVSTLVVALGAFFVPSAAVFIPSALIFAFITGRVIAVTVAVLCFFALYAAQEDVWLLAAVLASIVAVSLVRTRFTFT